MINIAKLLKDVPKGWKLYSPLFGEVNFVGIDKQSDYPINVTDCKGNGKSFTEFGVYFADHPDAECLLFPSKDCRTWEGWTPCVEPKFKVGDSIQSGSMWAMVRRIDTENQRYICQFDNVIPFEEQNRWNFVPKKHYDITNFKPFDKVLIRVGNKSKWTCDFFSYYHNGFHCIGCDDWRQCIPYEGNEPLLGTTDPCDERFINW